METKEMNIPESVKEQVINDLISFTTSYQYDEIIEHFLDVNRFWIEAVTENNVEPARCFVEHSFFFRALLSKIKPLYENQKK